MHLKLISILITFIVIFLVEFYSYQSVKVLVSSTIFRYIYILLSSFFVLYMIYFMYSFDYKVGQTQYTLAVFGIGMLILAPKLIITFFLMSEDILRLLVGSIKHFTAPSEGDFLASRRKFISQMAVVVAAVPFFSFIYGMTKGKYNFKVRKRILYFDNLPSAFDGFTLTQFSDVHSGSLDDVSKVEYAIDLINQQKSDLVLFTGDIVNSLATEMDAWLPIFNKIKTPSFGKYSILGNHDYGEYLQWDKEEDKKVNFKAIKDIHPKMGFQLLLNENIRLIKGDDEIALIGVENWGHNFKKAGDLKKASKGVSKDSFKILMSHDPSHWEHEVKADDFNYQLTLSGHTHGMQFGIEVPSLNYKWSLAKYVYKQWADLYEYSGRYIYVNRGFGYHFYPGRVGIYPEITVIELRKKQAGITESRNA